MGAPLGNQNARKRHWSDAIQRAVEEEDPLLKRRRIDALADRLIEKAMEGDVAAMREIGDRLDGKPAQSVQLGGDSENPLRLHIEK